MIEIGLKHTSELIVTEDVTAVRMGSGDMAVLATPAMMALMENAAMLAVAPHLPEGSTTVGGHIATSHLRPTPLGGHITATATVTNVDGKKIEFRIAAHCGDTLLGEGTHLRFIVDRKRFLERL
ncbi:MAG: thioesterase family protein [Muribaculaceae bacterium]|nr:thioesterase family protein [Muribaculaceae bacterium]